MTILTIFFLIKNVKLVLSLPFLTIYAKQTLIKNNNSNNILTGYYKIAEINQATYRGYQEAKQYLTILLIQNICPCLKDEERNKHL